MLAPFNLTHHHMNKATPSQKKPVTRNRFTGNPRKWVWGGMNKENVNLDLELIEAEITIGRSHGFVGTDPKTLIAMWNAYEEKALVFRNYLDGIGALLSESEMRYCKLEAIAPGDFVARKLAQRKAP